MFNTHDINDLAHERIARLQHEAENERRVKAARNQGNDQTALPSWWGWTPRWCIWGNSCQRIVDLGRRVVSADSHAIQKPRIQSL
jgi:hypothetical protein